MNFSKILKSPVFAPGHAWLLKKRKGYESEATVLIRAMQNDDQIGEDQRYAWSRWRTEDPRLPRPKA